MKTIVVKDKDFGNYLLKSMENKREYIKNTQDRLKKEKNISNK